jgi:dolichol-phosphate mannosyltransferase
LEPPQQEQQNGTAKPSFFFRVKAKSLRLIKERMTFVKFATVGASGVAVNEILLIGLHAIGLSALLSQAVGVEASIINNFVWNDSFTFKKPDRQGSKKLARLLKYNVLSLLTFALNLLVFSFLISRGWWYVYASVAAVLVSFVINFLGASKWAWGQRTDDKESTRSLSEKPENTE